MHSQEVSVSWGKLADNANNHSTQTYKPKAKGRGQQLSASHLNGIVYFKALMKQAWIKTVTEWWPKILDPFPTLATEQRQVPVLALELGQTDLQATYPINPMTTAPQSASIVAPSPWPL